MLEIIGFLGATCLSLCSLPQVVRTIRTNHVKSFDPMYLWLWFSGCVFMTTYILSTDNIMIPLLVNYMLNSLSVGILLFYYYRFRNVVQTSSK